MYGSWDQVVRGSPTLFSGSPALAEAGAGSVCLGNPGLGPTATESATWEAEPPAPGEPSGNAASAHTVTASRERPRARATRLSCSPFLTHRHWP